MWYLVGCTSCIICCFNNIGYAQIKVTKQPLAHLLTIHGSNSYLAKSLELNKVDQTGLYPKIKVKKLVLSRLLICLVQT